MKKVLLIQPPVTLPKKEPNFNANLPIGLAYIAAVLEKANYEVVMLDAVIEGYDYKQPLENDPNWIQLGMPFDEIGLFIRKCSPDFVGINAMFTSQSHNALSVAKVVKSMDHKIPVILGGAHTSVAYFDLLKDKSVDYVIIGEGEEAIVSLLKALEEKLPLDTVESLVFRGFNDTIVVNPKTKFVDVEQLPLPASHLLPMEKYFATGERHGLQGANRNLRSVPIAISRGCPFNCNFCSAYKVFGRKFRVRSAINILNEIEMLIETYKANDFYFVDDALLVNRQRITELLDGIINKRLNISLDAPNGISPWLLTEEIAEKMKMAGFGRVLLAIESGNQWVLDNIIDKPVRVDRLPEIVEMLRKYDFEIGAFLVLGNVADNKVETFSQMKDSFDLIRKLKIENPTISFLTPHLGTRVEETVRKNCYPVSDSPKRFYYNVPHFSTPEWSTDELFIFVTLESLCLPLPLGMPLAMMQKLPASWFRFLLLILNFPVRWLKTLLARGIIRRHRP